MASCPCLFALKWQPGGGWVGEGKAWWAQHPHPSPLLPRLLQPHRGEDLPGESGHLASAYNFEDPIFLICKIRGLGQPKFPAFNYLPIREMSPYILCLLVPSEMSWWKELRCGNQTEQCSNPGSSSSHLARTHLSQPQVTHLENGHELDPGKTK